MKVNNNYYYHYMNPCASPSKGVMQFLISGSVRRGALEDSNNNNNNFIKMATIAVELYNWHSKTTNDNKLIKTKI